MTTIDQSIVKVATVADLATVDASGLEDGDLAYVETLRSYFRLALTSAATLAANVVVAVSNGGRWLRTPERDLSWRLQAAWEIDPADGDDEATGAPGAPIASWAEFARRVNQLSTNITVTILSNITEALVGTFTALVTGLTLTVVGTPTVLASGTVLAAAEPSVNAEGTLTSAAIASWAAYVGRIVECTSGAAEGCQTVILANAAGTAQTPFWFRFTDYSTPLPAAGVDIRVLSMTTTLGAHITVVGADIVLRYLNIPVLRVSAALGQANYDSCEVLGGRIVPGTYHSFGSCVMQTDGFIDFMAGSRASYFGGASFQDVWLEESCDLNFGGHIIYTHSLNVGSDAGSEGSQNVGLQTDGLGIFNSPGAGALVGHGGRLTITTNGRLYGDGNTTYGLQVFDGGFVQIHEANVPTITGTTAAVNIDAQTTLVPPLTGGDAAVPVAAAFTTWAHWTAAPFYRVARNYAFNTAGVGSASGAAIVGT